MPSHVVSAFQVKDQRFATVVYQLNSTVCGPSACQDGQRGQVVHQGVWSEYNDNRVVRLVQFTEMLFRGVSKI